MANQMFKGFGGGMMMMEDPFANDPFFNGKGGDMMGFGGIDKMMKNMSKGMLMDAGDFGGSMGKGSHF